MLKKEDNHFQNMLKMKITLLKFLKNEDLKIPVKIVTKMKMILCAGSPVCGERSETGQPENFAEIDRNCLLSKFLLT